MAHMYGGSILTIDLSEGRISKESTSSYSNDFLGGRGVNIKLLYDRTIPESNPLDPSNVLIFGTGPLCGTPMSASRTEVTARSPETGFLGSSNFGGHFGPELKYAGYDHVVITGRAKKPVYISIQNERVEIRDAGPIWGKDTYETQSLIRADVSDEVQIACIGQAGENRVHYATIQHDLGHGAGRTGMGAVMGSKNLKAVAVRGTNAISLANPLRYLEIVEELSKEVKKNPSVQHVQKYGMSLEVGGFGVLHTDPDWAAEVDPFALVDKYKPKKTGCYGCLQQCMDLYPVEAKKGGAISCAFYSQPFTLVRNADVELALECGLQAQRYGIDIISSMGIIGWLMRLYEKGILTVDDTGGIVMEWGAREAILGMLKKIVYREGFGDTLANGILPAARTIGRGAEDHAYHVKGLPLYSPTTPYCLLPTKGRALCIAISSRGDAMRSMMAGREIGEEGETPLLMTGKDEKTAAEYAEALRNRIREKTGTEKAYIAEEYMGKPELVAFSEDEIVICDCLSSCKLIGTPYLNIPEQENYLAALVSAGTGREIGANVLFRFAKKVRNLERAYNARQGMTREADTLPPGFMDRPIGKNGSELKSTEFENMKSEYYRLRNWDAATGIPTREALEQTGLGDVAQDLMRRGKLPADC